MSDPYSSDPYSTPPVSTSSTPTCNPILHLVCSILLTVCCCNLIAVGGIVFAILSKSDLDAGRIESAVKNSKIAMWCNLGGLAVMVCSVVFYVVIVLLMVASGAATN